LVIRDTISGLPGAVAQSGAQGPCLVLIGAALDSARI
jgi:hypothetical protein